MAQTINIHQTIRTSAENLWRACADVAGVAGWQADEASGSLDPGGTLTLSWPSLGTSIELSVFERVEGKRIVLGSQDSQVRFEVADGRIEITHSGLLSSDEAEGVSASWRAALSVLRHGLQIHDGRARSVLWAMQSIRITVERAHLFFTDAAAQRTWLASGGTGFGRADEAYSLHTQWGETLSGEILCRVPERDVAVSWQEAGESVLVFRTLPSPFRDDERLVSVAWSRWVEHARPARVQREWTRALSRLRRAVEGAGHD
ncbi:MAG TPA: hypothetical protein VF989_11405 [Polyangiaceae bacterium]